MVFGERIIQPTFRPFYPHIPHNIYYASKVLNENQFNYSTNEKELLVVVFALENFHSYLIGSRVVAFTVHATLKYLIIKGDFTPQLLR